MFMNFLMMWMMLMLRLRLLMFIEMIRDILMWKILTSMSKCKLIFMLLLNSLLATDLISHDINEYRMVYVIKI